MKKILFIILLLLIGSKVGYTQTYILTKPILIPKTNAKGDSTGEYESLEKGWLLNVVQETKDSKVFQIIPFKGKNKDDSLIVALNKRLATYSKYVKDSKGNRVLERLTNYFKVTNAEFSEAITQLHERWTFGTVILPLKLRFGDTDSKGNNLRYFDFTSEINVGLSLAWRMTKANSRTIDTYLFGSLNLSSIPMDSANTKGFQKIKTNASAISPTTGLVVHFKKSGLQLITTIGLDFIAGELGRKWVYRNQPWLGIGVGFSIFKFGDKGTVTEQVKK